MEDKEANKRIEEWENRKLPKNAKFVGSTNEASYVSHPLLYEEKAGLANPEKRFIQMMAELKIKNRKVVMAQWQYDELLKKAKPSILRRLWNKIWRK